MIVRSKLHWFRMIFAWRGSVLPKIMPRLPVPPLPKDFILL